MELSRRSSLSVKWESYLIRVPYWLSNFTAYFHWLAEDWKN